MQTHDAYAHIETLHTQTYKDAFCFQNLRCCQQQRKTFLLQEVMLLSWSVGIMEMIQFYNIWIVGEQVNVSQQNTSQQWR